MNMKAIPAMLRPGTYVLRGVSNVEVIGIGADLYLSFGSDLGPCPISRATPNPEGWMIEYRTQEKLLKGFLKPRVT